MQRKKVVFTKSENKNQVDVEVKKFPTTISKWEYASINGGHKGESESGGEGGEVGEN